MISIHDLLEDSRYKEFLCQVPQLPDHVKSNPQAKPWRLYVKLKKDGRWRSKDYATYKEAFLALKKWLPKASDAAINSKAEAFLPPSRVVKIRGRYQENKNGSYVLDAQGKKKPLTRTVPWQPVIPSGEFEDHLWCSYCRRPTVFKYFVSHHALPPKKLGGMPIDPTMKRCAICGASLKLVSSRLD